MVGNSESAGLNRHVVGDESPTGKESSESILASSLAGEIARSRLKRRQGIGGVGYGAPACPEKERQKADVFSGTGNPTEARVRTS
jgi:hypothetical protein